MQYAEYKEYIAKKGDRWDTIAYMHYGNAFKYAPLIMANSDTAIQPFIEEGTKIIIPLIEKDDENEDLPPWKK